jgi:phosphatidyl-myo-inositol alpha-mannosyltransferase
VSEATRGARVALVCPHSWSVPGGIQGHVAGLARTLRARGVDADILAPADGPVSLPGFVNLGRTIGIPDNGAVTRLALGPLAARRTWRQIASGGYALVHLHDPMLPAVALTALLTARVPLVGTFHMYASEPGWYRRFGPVCRRALARLDVRIAVSEAARFHVARSCPGDYLIIPNGVDVAAPTGAPPDGGPGRVLFVGRPQPRKGLPILLEAFSRLPGQPTLDLVGVSAAELTGLPGLGQEAAPRVRARGVVDDAERARLLGQADVLCAPSLGGESFGMVLVEGMAAGRPVVASAIPGYVDVLPPACGRLVPPGDPASLAGALGALLADDELRRRLGAAGRAEAQRYDWSRVGDQVLAVYESLLADPPLRPDRAGRRPGARGRRGAQAAGAPTQPSRR